MPGKSHRQRRLVGYSPWGCKRAGHDFVTKQQQRHPLPCSQASANVLMTVVNITWILAVCGETTVCLYALPYPHVLDEMTEQLSHSAQVQSWDLNWALSTLSPLTYTSVLSASMVSYVANSTEGFLRECICFFVFHIKDAIARLTHEFLW